MDWRNEITIIHKRILKQDKQYRKRYTELVEELEKDMRLRLLYDESIRNAKKSS